MNADLPHKLLPSIRSLQIGNVNFSEQAGGLSRVYHELFNHLPESGVHFSGLVVGDKAVETQGARAIEVFARPGEPLYKRLLKARESIRMALLSDEIDLVASHFALYTFPALLDIGTRPLVVHFHGPWASEAQIERPSTLRHSAQVTLESSVYRRASRSIVLSSAFAHELASRYRVREDTIRVIPPGVDLARFNCNLSRTEARQRLGWPLDRFIIVTVRRLARRMGLEDLISAVSLLHHRHPEVQLYIAGKGDLSAPLKDQISHLNVGTAAKLLGRVEDSNLPLIYRAADLSVVPTTALEGFGMITLESLACGTPVMVTPVGGLPEVVRDLSPSLIFPSTGADSVAESISALLSGRIKLPSDSQCRSYVESKFTWRKTCELVRDVYQEALSN